MASSVFSFASKFAARMAKISAMAGKGLAASTDDIALQIKTGVGISTDDVPVKTQSISGLPADQEKEFFKAFVKKAVMNRLVIVPAVAAVTAFLPAIIPYVLMAGGALLSYEFAEKLTHTAHHTHDHIKHNGGLVKTLGELKQEHGGLAKAALALLKSQVYSTDEGKDAAPVTEADVEQEKKELLASATMTDRIMALELVCIMAASLSGAAPLYAAAILAASTTAVSASVLGLTYGLIRADNVGMAMTEKNPDSRLGNFILKGAPIMMYALGIVGTLAMGIIGGELLAAGITPVHHMIEGMSALGGTALAAGMAYAGGAVIMGAQSVYGKTLREPLSKIVAPLIGKVKNLLPSRNPAPSLPQPENIVAPAPAFEIRSAGLAKTPSEPAFNAATVSGIEPEAAPQATPQAPKPNGP